MTDCASLLNGKAAFPRPGHETPNSGIVTFQDSKGVTHQIDILHTVLGAKAIEASAATIALNTGVEVKLMHPLLCLQSRVANIGGSLKRRDPHAINQLRAASCFVPAYFQELLSFDAQLYRRHVIECNQAIYELCASLAGLETFEVTGVDPFQAIHLDPALDPFPNLQYPRLCRWLREKRRKRGLPPGIVGETDGQDR